MSVRVGLFSLTYEGMPAVSNSYIYAWYMPTRMIPVSRITPALRRYTGVWT